MQVTGRAIVVFVSLVGLASFTTGWWMTANVRETARRTDGELEALAAALQAWSVARGGDFPTSQAAFLDGCAGPARASVEAALRHVQVRWPPSGDLAPILDANGMPSGLGTLDRLNRDLRASARAAAASGAPSPTP